MARSSFLLVLRTRPEPLYSMLKYCELYICTHVVSVLYMHVTASIWHQMLVSLLPLERDEKGVTKSGLHYMPGLSIYLLLSAPQGS